MPETLAKNDSIATSNAANAVGDATYALRWGVYLLLITLSVGTMLGRILAVDSVDRTAVQEFRTREALRQREDEFKRKGLEGERLARAIARIKARFHSRRPFLSSNDRSRWAVVRALVEPDMRVAGAPYAIDKVVVEDNWDTIDMVKHDGRDGRDGHDGHLYSSKPPLLPTLVAGPYWLIHRLSGATLGTHPYAIDRFMLIVVNVLPLTLAFLLLGCLVERMGTSDWGRFFVMASAAFGTFLTTFSVVLNNHLPAAVSSIIAVYAFVRIRCDADRRVRWFFLAGLFAAFTAANELPALAFLAAVAAVLAWTEPRRTLLCFAPAVLLIAAAFFATNWIAHHSLAPPYMHRSGQGEANWYDFTYEKNGQTIESYWRNPKGIDRGETSTAVYALHALVGHHGIFSLTPIWLMSIAGMFIWIAQRRDRRLRELALLIGSVSAVCLIFYIFIEHSGRNYGGMTSGFRWMFWFAPMWLLLLLPAADAASRRRFWRAVALVLLAVATLSAAYPTWNPWTHPWLMNCIHFLV